MDRTLIASLRTLLDNPDRPDRDALFAVLDDEQASNVLACLAPQGSLHQIAAALRIRWAWSLEGWERQIDALVAMITDPRCLHSGWMLFTWSCIPNVVGVLRDRTDDLIAWAEERLAPMWYTYLAILLGPSDKSARLILQSPFSDNIGRSLRCWSMVIDPDDPTAWQAMIATNLRKRLRRKATPSQAFPAWGGDDTVDSGIILDEIVDNFLDGWSPDHPSIRSRIAWVENHVTPTLFIGHLAIVASLGRSDALAEAVRVRLPRESWAIPTIAQYVPWSRLHPRIQDAVDETMRQASNPTWACAIGQAPLVPDTTIDADILLWRIAPERWNDLDPSIRDDLVSSIKRPVHCYGWGVHPDLVTGKYHPYSERVFRLWNPNVPPDDLRAWVYADVLHEQRTHQKAQVYADVLREQKNRQKAWMLIDLLDTLPPDRRTRFEQIIDWRLGGRSEPTAQPPWEWTDWLVLSGFDRLTRLRDWLAILWGDHDTSPVVHLWRARNDRLSTVVFRVIDVLGVHDLPSILAGLLAQVPVIRRNMTDVRPWLPFPNDMDAARRAQIEWLPLTPDAKAYAAWCLWFLDKDEVLGINLIALHPDVASALAPILNPDRQKQGLNPQRIQRSL